jgi:presqualene diphosphate synthase
MTETATQAHHEAETQGRAKGSSFYLAMRILPKAQRQAMFEIYSFCRLVDDIADEGGPRPARHAALAQWRRDIDALYAGETPPPALRELAAAIHAFGLRREDFIAVIDGMDMDVEGDIQAPDWQTLELYCDRVASAVGRLSVRVFGTPDADGVALADHLGKALQLTNILRDIDEDAEINRLYLPREALQAAGITATDPRSVAADPRLGDACKPVIARARDHFAMADTIMRRCPRASVRACRIMGEAYGAILNGVAARGFAAPRQRVKVSKARFLLALLKHGLI